MISASKESLMTKGYHKKKAPLSQGYESKAVSLLEFLAKSAADREADGYLS